MESSDSVQHIEGNPGGPEEPGKQPDTGGIVWQGPKPDGEGHEIRLPHGEEHKESAEREQMAAVAENEGWRRRSSKEQAQPRQAPSAWQRKILPGSQVRRWSSLTRPQEKRREGGPVGDTTEGRRVRCAVVMSICLVPSQSVSSRPNLSRPVPNLSVPVCVFLCNILTTC